MARKLLIFDLDETLVHASTEKLSRSADFEFSPYFVYKRPHLHELLSATRPHYDFAVWSSSTRKYVDTVVAAVFGTAFEVKFSWAVDRCIQRVDSKSNSYVYIKDLRRVQGQGYLLEQIIMLDDSPEKIARQPRNHLRIKPFFGSGSDTELLAIAEDLVERARHWDD